MFSFLIFSEKSSTQHPLKKPLYLNKLWKNILNIFLERLKVDFNEF